MPIDKNPGESKDEFISRCISVEIKAGKESDQAAAICYAKWDEFAVIGPRGGIKESPKAPKSGTPNKNPEGEGSSKGDSSTTRGTEVSKEVEATLKQKADDFNEKYKEKLGYGVDVGMLKTVFQRGKGAFNVSHSPRVQSAEQWAYARVNAFLYIVKNGRPENPKYVNDNDLLPKKHKKNSDMSSDIELESYSDYPDSVKNNAKSVLDWTEKNGWGSCGTPVGKIRANQLANGEPISADTIQRMFSYLSRHEVDLQTSKSYSDGCGKLMYDSWGGLSAKSWAESKIKELNLGTQSVTDNTWSTEAPISIQLSKISFDYDDTLSTAKGKEMAKLAIRRGDEVYIISARNDRSGLLDIANELNIPYSRVYATGSNRAKEAKVKELGIDKHIDNNVMVVRALPGVGQKFKAVRKVIFNEDFDDATVIEYIEKGFKVHIRSSRKIQRRDRKVWNKLRAVGLTEDVMVFGEVKDLDKRYEYDLLMTGQDPILERLKLMGEDGSKYKVLSSKRVDSMSEALSAQTELVKGVDLKFIKVLTRYTYEEIAGIPAAKSGSRPFCSQLRSTPTRMYSLEEISSLSTTHLSDMGLPDDVFQYRGGFYRNPETDITTAGCRHFWKVNIVIEQ
jgi:hypothetical protein